MPVVIDLGKITDTAEQAVDDTRGSTSSPGDLVRAGFVDPDLQNIGRTRHDRL